jgi:hypothetical protein
MDYRRGVTADVIGEVGMTIKVFKAIMAPEQRP